MDPFAEVAAKEGVSISDIQIIEVQEIRISPTTVQRRITYVIRKRGILRMVDEIMRRARIFEPTSQLAFMAAMNRNLSVESADDQPTGRVRQAALNAASEIVAHGKDMGVPAWLKKYRWTRPYPANRLPWLGPKARSGVYMITLGNGMPIAGLNVPTVGAAENLKKHVRAIAAEIRAETPSANYTNEYLRQFEQAEPGDDVFIRWLYAPNQDKHAEQIRKYFQPA